MEGLSGGCCHAHSFQVPDPARPPQGCRFHTRCRMATAVCGWEVDDVIRQLEDVPGMFDALSGVERQSEFSAHLTFENEDSATRLVEVLNGANIPTAMKSALQRLDRSDRTVKVEFAEVSEVELEQTAPGRIAACVREPQEVMESDQT